MGFETTGTNISKDAETGLQSKAYFLINLEHTIAELQIPERFYGLLAISIQNPSKEQLMQFAKWVREQADYATHYATAQSSVIAGVFVLPGILEYQASRLQEEWQKSNPSLRFGITNLELTKDSKPEPVLEQVAKQAYENMLKNQPAP